MDNFIGEEYLRYLTQSDLHINNRNHGNGYLFASLNSIYYVLCNDKTIVTTCSDFQKLTLEK